MILPTISVNFLPGHLGMGKDRSPVGRDGYLTALTRLDPPVEDLGTHHAGHAT